VKNHPQKLLRITQIHFFFFTASTAQMARTEEFMFQDVAYRPTVYRTGDALMNSKLLESPETVIIPTYVFPISFNSLEKISNTFKREHLN
jgi:hypothetical protein